MCGILGSVNIGLNSTVLDTIKHRGPDDFGLERFAINGHKIELNHRRLSIIDLSPAGHQPMNTACNNYSVIFNGEIYNHEELRQKLPKDVEFRGHSDTETILYYLKEFGIKGIKDFNGIFAFAYVDKISNVIYLARDPFGVKPLYYHFNEENGVVFSSEIRPIKHLQAQNGVDKDALATSLRLRYNPSPDTIYAGIKKIRPGHYLEINLNADTLVSKHESFICPVPKTISYPANKVVNLYGKKLEEAVKRQLLSDVEVGILLSGGIDSAMVAALAKKHYAGRLKAFTIGFDGDYEEDEIEAAAETAELLGLEHHFKKISFADFLNVIKVCTGIVEEPLATTSIIPMYFLSELTAKHVKVVLTGQGADEPLGGYTRYKSELIGDYTPRFLHKLIPPIFKLANIKSEQVLRGINAMGITNVIERFLAVYEVFNKEEIEKLISVDERHSGTQIAYFYNLLQCENKRHPVERMMALDTRLNLADDLLNYTDKITMHYSIECRVPMLDVELVNFIESLPAHLKLSLKKGGKIIHKDFARQILPGKIINRKKKAFQSPTKLWFKKESHIIEEMLLAGGTEFSRHFNQRYVAQIINQHKQGFNKEKQIFLLLSIYFILSSIND